MIDFLPSFTEFESIVLVVPSFFLVNLVLLDFLLDLSSFLSLDWIFLHLIQEILKDQDKILLKVIAEALIEGEKLLRI